MNPTPLLSEYLFLFLDKSLPGPVLDLASGDGHNGLYLAMHGIPVICCDRSRASLNRALVLAAANRVTIDTWEVDLEVPEVNPLPSDTYGGILVFRYLHRPLIQCIRSALKPGGVLMYETFTIEQSRFGKPRNPDFLLKPGELLSLYKDWEVLHYFEGIKNNPDKAIARIVCRKPRQ